MPILAAIDIGANSVRLSIASYRGRRGEVLHQDREVTRLGDAVFRTGLLAPGAMAATVEVLRRFRRATLRYHADAVRVVATSALRNARNRSLLLDWTRAATGWEIEVIDGLEEGRLIHRGIITQSELHAARVLLIDLGGGSCEFTLSVQRRIRQIYSLPLGAVRLTAEFLEHDPPKKKELQRLSTCIGAELDRIAPKILATGVHQAIATSGTAAALARLNHSPEVAQPAVTRILRQLSRISASQRAKLTGVGPRRAEIIVAGAAVYAELLTRLGLPGFRYSPLGLRDGVLAQMAAEPRFRRAPDREAERARSLAALAEQYGVERAYARHVRALALELFRSLRRLHQLPAEYAGWIAAAAQLAGVGNFINLSAARHHTEYILAHSEIAGFTLAERRGIAALAHAQAGALPPPEQPSLRRAAVLLRLALALDQGRRGAVRALRVRLLPAQVSMHLQGPGKLDLELWAAERERAGFREVFGRDLILRAG
ncbi:MAG TPA: Ppx/GppA phosphatase family protein [Terriglobales bacterium]|nr:Ppx/GppA phosphatase family protein [Terriglobales bacterium]